MAKKLKILQIIGGGEIAGSKHQFLGLCREQISRGHSLRIACFLKGELEREAHVLQIPISVLPMHNILDLRVIRPLRQLILKEKYEIVHTHGVRANFIGRIAAKGTGAGILTTIYSFPKEDYKNPLKRFLYPPIDRWTVPLAHRLIAVSHGLKEKLVESKTAEAEKISVIHCAIDPKATELVATGEQMRRELAIPPSTPACGMLARLVHVKNPFLLLDVAAIIKGQLPQALFFFVGDGPYLQPLKKACEERGLAENIHFTGYRQDPLNVVQALDVIVLTSISEGLPVTLLEAMLLGKPVVGTRVGGVPEVVKDQVTGFLVSSGDAAAFAERLLYLFRHPDEARKMGGRGHTWVKENFSLQVMVDRIEAIYAEVLKNAG